MFLPQLVASWLLIRLSIDLRMILWKPCNERVSREGGRWFTVKKNHKYQLETLMRMLQVRADVRWLGRACVIAVSQVSGNGSRAISTHVLRRGREPEESDGVVNLRSKSKGDYSTNGGEFSSRGALSFTQTNSADAPFVWAAFRPLPHAEDKFFRCFDEAALLANWIWWARRLWAAMNNSKTWVTRSLPQRPPLINRNFSLCLIFVDYLPARFREAKKFTKRLKSILSA